MDNRAGNCPSHSRWLSGCCFSGLFYFYFAHSIFCPSNLSFAASGSLTRCCCRGCGVCVVRSVQYEASLCHITLSTPQQHPTQHCPTHRWLLVDRDSGRGPGEGTFPLHLSFAHSLFLAGVFRPDTINKHLTLDSSLNSDRGRFNLIWIQAHAHTHTHTHT